MVAWVQNTQENENFLDNQFFFFFLICQNWISTWNHLILKICFQNFAEMDQNIRTTQLTYIFQFFTQICVSNIRDANRFSSSGDGCEHTDRHKVWGCAINTQQIGCQSTQFLVCPSFKICKENQMPSANKKKKNKKINRKLR